MRNNENVLRHVERVAAYVCGLDGNLNHDGRLGRLRYVDNAEAQRCAFVRQEENALPVGILLEDETFTTISVLVEIVVADNFQILRFERCRPVLRKQAGREECGNEQKTRKHSGADYILVYVAA